EGNLIKAKTVLSDSHIAGKQLLRPSTYFRNKKAQRLVNVHTGYCLPFACLTIFLSTHQGGRQHRTHQIRSTKFTICGIIIHRWSKIKPLLWFLKTEVMEVYMKPQTQSIDAVELLLQARTARKPIASIPTEILPKDLASAYRLQETLVEELLSKEHGTAIGYK